MEDAPWPQPTSATLAPRFSLASTPSSAGIHAPIKFPRYPERKKRSVPWNRIGSWSPHSMPAPLRNAWAMRGSARIAAAITWNAPGRKAGLVSSASASACSGGRV